MGQTLEQILHQRRYTNVQLAFEKLPILISYQGYIIKTIIICHFTLREMGITSVQLLSCVQLFMTPQTAAQKASLFLTISRILLKFMSIDLVMPSNHLIFCHPLLLPSIFPIIRVFWLFESGEQSIWASALVLPMNIQSWFPLGLTGLISSQSKGQSKIFSSTTVQFFATQTSLWSSFPMGT